MPRTHTSASEQATKEGRATTAYSKRHPSSLLSLCPHREHALFCPILFLGTSEHLCCVTAKGIMRGGTEEGTLALCSLGLTLMSDPLLGSGQQLRRVGRRVADGRAEGEISKVIEFRLSGNLTGGRAAGCPPEVKGRGWKDIPTSRRDFFQRFFY